MSDAYLIMEMGRALDEARSDRKRLASAIDAIREAVWNEGQHPDYHKEIVTKHRNEWPKLWDAIDRAIGEIAAETQF